MEVLVQTAQECGSVGGVFEQKAGVGVLCRSQRSGKNMIKFGCIFDLCLIPISLSAYSVMSELTTELWLI